MICLLILLFSLLSMCLLITRHLNLHWKHQNVPYEPGAIPIFGNLLPVFLLQDNLGTLTHRMYLKMGSKSMLGCHFMHTPAVLIRDPRLIQQVLDNDFSSSLAVLDDKLDPIMTKSAFFARGEVWRDARGLVARSFREGRLRSLLVLVNEVCEEKINVVDGRDFETRDLFTRLIGELVSRSVFGVSDPEFPNFAKSIFQPCKLRALLHNIRFFLPKLSNFFGISFMPGYLNNYIRTHLQERNDMLVACNTALFFDGYEPMSSLLSFMVYYIARDARVQEKARLEVLKNHQDYQALKKTGYLDQIILETLRMHPAFGEITRVCDKEVSLRGYDGLECKLRPGDIVLVSVSGIHNDQEFWSDPGIFKPERFQGKNEFCFLGFGRGPRACPGRRAAMLVVKAVLASLLLKYSLRVSEKGPLKLNPGLWVNFKPLDATD